MTVMPVIHVFNENAALVRASLEASIALDGKITGANLLIFRDRNFNDDAFVDLYSRGFENWNVEETDPIAPGLQWPLPQNLVWQQAARWIDSHRTEFKERAWLWWEADATPLRPGWLSTLSDAYRKTRKLFAGVPCLHGNDTPYMNGVGIYPTAIVDALSDCAALYCRNTPFDISAGSCVMRSFADISKLMIHERKLNGGTTGATFTRAKLDMLLVSRPQAVFHHGCGDGTLHALAAGKTLPTHSPRVIMNASAITTPLHTISILCYKLPEITKACIQSVIDAGGDFELIVTDNGSGDGTLPYLKSLKPLLGDRLVIVSNAKNEGFNRPNNHALTLARGRYFTLLNNDMVVVKGWLDILSAPFRSNPRLAQVGLDNTCCHLSSQCHGEPHLTQVDYIECSCMMTLTSIVREHGLFSSYLSFAYYEDCDLSLRLREAGYDVKMVHIKGMDHDPVRSSTTKLVMEEGSVNLHAYMLDNREAMLSHWGFYLKAKSFESRRVLVKRRGARGDVLFSTPILKAMRHKWPSAQIDFLTECADLVPSSLATPVKEANDSDYTNVYDLDLAYEKVPTTHVVDAYAEVCDLKGVGRRPYFETDSGHDYEDPYDRLFLEKVVVIHCGPTVWKGRNWPQNRFDALATCLSNMGWTPVTVGTGEDWRLTSVISRNGQTTPSQLYAFLQCATLFIGIDSLPFNLAQAAGIPAIGLFGTIDPQYRLSGLPWHVGLHGDPTKTLCIGAHHRLPPPVTFSECDGACMRAITVEQVLDAVPHVLSSFITSNLKPQTITYVRDIKSL